MRYRMVRPVSRSFPPYNLDVYALPVGVGTAPDTLQRRRLPEGSTNLSSIRMHIRPSLVRVPVVAVRDRVPSPPLGRAWPAVPRSAPTPREGGEELSGPVAASRHGGGSRGSLVVLWWIGSQGRVQGPLTQLCPGWPATGVSPRQAVRGDIPSWAVDTGNDGVGVRCPGPAATTVHDDLPVSLEPAPSCPRPTHPPTKPLHTTTTAADASSP
jgi:hypothetical protein